MKTKANFVTTTLVATIMMGMSASVLAEAVNDSTLFTVVEDFENFDGWVTQGPTVLNGGILVESSILSTLGAQAVDLGNNGVWGAGNRFAGMGDLSFMPESFDYNGSMTFKWATGQQGVGATFSIYQQGANDADILLETLDFNGDVLESVYVLINFNDTELYNAGMFNGFLSNSRDVFGLRVSGVGFVLDNVSVAPVPVPAALPLMASGLAAMGALLRRRKKA